MPEEKQGMIVRSGEIYRAQHPKMVTSWQEFVEALKFKYPGVYKPRYRVMMQDTAVELWFSPRHLPWLLNADAIIVPVGPDLKMVNGAAKLIRDASADRVQYEANRVAPLAPGDSFVGTGARYHSKFIALAVIFDQYKRTSPDLIRRSVRSAALAVSQRGAKSILLTDFTENLLAQPNWITDEQFQATAEATATAMIEAVRACRGAAKTIKVWVWDPRAVSYYEREMRRLTQNS